MSTSSYKGRVGMEEKMESILTLDELFTADVFTSPVSVNVESNETIKESTHLKNISTDASFMIKHMPDYVLSHKTNYQTYFVDLKLSSTPLLYFSRLKQIRELDQMQNRYHSANVGIMAREAFFSYKKYYPKTIVLYASPYNPKLLMAQFIEDIKVLYVGGANYYKDSLPNKITTNADFTAIEIMHPDYFELTYNSSSTGSGTQHVNIDLDSFEPFEDFFNKLAFPFDQEKLEEAKKKISEVPINIRQASKPENTKEFFKNMGIDGEFRE